MENVLGQNLNIVDPLMLLDPFTIYPVYQLKKTRPLG
jgi:hypothetical protein